VRKAFVVPIVNLRRGDQFGHGVGERTHPTILETESNLRV